MALRNQPYLPLYVQDFLTDEKLIECSAESTGVYIRLLCLMHKSDEYGTILLKQKYKQTESTCLNFAYMIAKQMPYSEDVVKRSLEELLQEGVLLLDDNKLIQKRMVKDNELSLVRSKAGSTGGKVAQAKVKANIQANIQANTEYEIVNENDNDINVSNDIKEIINYLNSVLGTNFKITSKQTQSLIKARIKDGFTVDDFKLVIDKKFNEWDRTDMSKFLRPETLFSNKFEGYVNQQINTTLTKGEKNARVSDDIIRSISKDNEVNGNFMLTI
jgi:uncharacterized phage protein (TIGR02220 family)